MQAFLASIRAASASATPTTTDAEQLCRYRCRRWHHSAMLRCTCTLKMSRESVHELLDLYLACVPAAASLAVHGICPRCWCGRECGCYAVAAFARRPCGRVQCVPSSSAGLSDPAPQPANARRKLKQYEYSPPPFGLVEWLNSSRCFAAAGAGGQGLGSQKCKRRPHATDQGVFGAADGSQDLSARHRVQPPTRRRRLPCRAWHCGTDQRLPQQGAAGMEPVTPSGEVGAAQSVAIELQPMTGARADALASLDKERMQVVKASSVANSSRRSG